MGRAAVCAGGRRPAREIATREPAARSGRSRGPPWPCRRPPAPRPGPAGPAAASNRACVRVLVLPPPSTPAAPSVLCGVGQASQAPRRPPIGRARACPGPAAALHTGGAFDAVWCRPGLAGHASASDRACACLSWPCRRPPAPRPDPAGLAAGSGTCFRGMYSAISHVIPLRVFQVLKSDR